MVDKTTRRDFIKALGKTSAAALAVAPLISLASSLESNADSIPLGCAQTCDCLVPCPAAKTKWHKAFDDLEFSEAPAPPYGPAERTTALDECTQKIDDMIITLERLYDFIAEARALPPNQVDGDNLLKLYYQAGNAVERFDEALMGNTFDDLFGVATGQRSFYWCMRDDILNDPKLDFKRARFEIDAFKEDYPGQVAELQALLNARLGV